MGTIVQTFGCDPAPTNTGNLGGATEPVGTNQQHMRLAPATATTAGNPLVLVGCIAALTAHWPVSVSDPINGDWAFRGPITNPTNGLSLAGAYILNPKSIPAGFVGKVSASSATTLTATKLDGTTSPGWTTNQWAGAVFTEYSTGATQTVSSNTANVLTFPSTSAPTVGNPFVVGGYVRVEVNGFDDYSNATCLELGGLEPYGWITDVLSQQAPGTTYAAGDMLTAGYMRLPDNAKCTVVAFGNNDVDGGTTPFNLLADTTPGTPAVDDGTAWRWDVTSDILRIEHGVLAGPGTTRMLFQSRAGSGSDHFQGFAIAFRDAVPAVNLGGILLPRRRTARTAMDLNIKEWW